ncbi:BQ2448_1756 [Microbotryum intermedium]|uniref:BQ2448_1756 protein n=1 Tax=Microbotryum intermedium TaxID=269621 RepID=A0A238F909_9BASI|nr:BQ2448_1756 [Microbotryum intermedium]
MASSSTFNASASHQPLYAFALPSELVQDLRVRKLVISESHPLHPSQALVKSTSTPTPAAPSRPDQLSITAGAFTCALTGASFNDLQGLKDHYKTDWYKYNVKLKLQGKPTPVSEHDFAQLVEALSASISGSESDSVSDDDDDASSSSTNAVSRLVRKQSLESPANGEAVDALGDPRHLNGPRSALIWFEAPNASPGTQYGIYRAALPSAGGQKKHQDGLDGLDELKASQLVEPVGSKGIYSTKDGKDRKWTLLMFGGGHFAGMVVSVVPRLVGKGKGKEKEKEVVVLEKKTFHRYTTRRKQGGSQSAHDGGSGKAKSAGAQIRRHNETALTEEVRELLSGWREHIEESELVFLRCSKTNYKTFFDHDGAPIQRGDPRIRGFSFPTRRPTINELVRAFTELTRVKVSHLTSDELVQLDADYLASITPRPVPVASKSKPAGAPSKQKLLGAPKLTKEEELERDRWERCIDMVKRGKIEALSTFLDKYGPELESSSGGQNVWGSLPEWMVESKSMPTLLHIASASDQAEMVRWLLVEKRADPTLRPPTKIQLLPAPAGEGETDDTTMAATTKGLQTPYELAPSRTTRNVFRALMAEHPEWWDWAGTAVGGARVPSALDEQKESEKDQKSRERRDKLREKQKERDLAKGLVEKNKEEEYRVLEEAKEKARKEAERRGITPTVNKGPQRLGGVGGAAKQAPPGSGLSEEQRMRVEREARARAAEARLKRLG